MLKKELEVKVTELEEKNEYLLESNKSLVKESMESGDHLIDEPFIPEYIGFEENELEDSLGWTVGRIYNKDGYSISKIQDNSWLVLCPDGHKNRLTIENMLEGIIGLKMSGMNISPADLLDEDETIKKIDIIVGGAILGIDEGKD